MFLRSHGRKKDGKDHIYWSLVETVRTADGPRQRTLCYLGELNSSAQARWLTTVEVFNEQGEAQQLKLFPSHVECLPDDPQVARVLLNDLRWMELRAKPSVSLTNGRYVMPDNCGDDKRFCPSLTFDSVNYGALTGIDSAVAAVVLTYHTGGTAHWQYVYLLTLESGKPRLLAWLRTGSRASQGLRGLSITAGNLVLVVNDPEKSQADCCSAGTITTRYRWSGSSFAAVGQPIHKNDPPSFDCAKAATPVEVLICKDVELSFLDSQMANSYKMAVKDASAERKEVIRRQQAEWFADYSRTCNARLSEAERHDCIDRFLSDRLTTIWK